jgi:cold shock protein
MTGTIRTLRTDKGFGFIKDAGGKEYFFHQSAVQGEGIKDLREGDSVDFEVGQGPKGPRAERPTNIYIGRMPRAASRLGSALRRRAQTATQVTTRIDDGRVPTLRRYAR